jgi:hypothetical protein
MSIRSALVGVLFVLALVGVANMVSAHDGDPDVVHTCVGKPTVSKGADIRVFQAGEACPKDTTSLHLAMPGAGGGSGLEVRDANDQPIGPLVGINAVAVVGDGRAFQTNVSEGGFSSPFSFPFVFTTADCTGTAYAFSSGSTSVIQLAIHMAGKVYFPKPPAVSTTVQSGKDVNGSCGPPVFGPGTFNLIPYGEIDVSGFVPPFHVVIP